MARQYGRIKTSIWADDDFRQLSDTAQALYMRLLSSPTMNLCGVCDWRPKRLALLTRGMTENKVNAAAAELVENRYIVVDEASDEVLVRTFIKHENVIANPKTAAGMDAAFGQVVSPLLRGVIADQVRVLREQELNLSGWNHVPITLAYQIDTQSDCLSDRVSDRPSDRVSILQEPLTKNQEPRTVTIDGDFVTWYSTYPKKAARPKALTAYRKARTKTDAATLLSSARVWAKAYAKDTTFCPNPATWLNQERWNDEQQPKTEPAHVELDELGFAR